MRRILLIVGSLVVMGLAFAAYIELQTPPPKAGVSFQPIDAPPPPDAAADVGQTAHESSTVFLKSYDSRTHKLSNQIRADTFTPHPDGTIDMTNPQADFFMGGGQMIRINGETGNFYDPNAVAGKMQGQSQTPSRGNMQHVILKLFKAVNDTEPQFTCWVNNLAFDNDTTTIATEDCSIPDASGNPVATPADQVPVHVVGIDYDFDGRGLVIKWNERDRHLERLEVAHGEQLVIKHPNAMGASKNAVAPPTSRPAEQPVSSDTVGPLSDSRGPIALVSANDADALSAAGTSIAEQPQREATTSPTTKPKKKRKKKPTTKPTAPPTSAPVIHRSKDVGVYRATFFDNVHVTQEGKTLATADRMNVDFFMGNNHASTEPSTQASTQLVTQPSALTTSDTADETPTPQSEATAASADAAAQAFQPAPPKQPAEKKQQRADSPSTPTTQPEQPIIVRWTGKLIVAPPDADNPPLVEGDSVLQFVGDSAPAVLDRDGSTIHCASFRYHTLDGGVQLDGSPAFPQVSILDAKGTKVYAPQVIYGGHDNAATIAGPATAEFPVSTNSGSAATRTSAIATATWTDSCTLQLQHTAKGETQVSEALLDGDVHVDHPQVKLNADELDLSLDTDPRSAPRVPSTQDATGQDAGGFSASGQLKEMDASGAVDCTLHDSQGKAQHILADHLTFKQKRDEDGNDVPSNLTADGTVHTFDPTQSLECGHLTADLEPLPPAATGPATRPQGQGVQLRELIATDNVHFKATDGSFADADFLHVQTLRPASPGVPADQEMSLMGQPTARVGDKQNSVSGPIIHYNPGTKLASVIGPGSLKGTQQTLADASHPGATTRPIEVTWKERFNLDGNANRADIRGDVHASSVSADGTINAADGDRIKMTLVDAPPTTQSSTAGASISPATQANSSSGLLARGDDTNFMKDKLVDTMTLLAKPGENVALSSIDRDAAGKLIHAMNLFATTAKYDRASDSFIVPVPGRMLVRDFRSGPTTGPSSASSPTPGAKGISAFEWEKSLTYNQHLDEAIMTGDVQVVHQAAGAASYKLFADQVTVDMDPAGHATTHPTVGTSKPTTAPADSMKVKRLVADGNVRLMSQKLGFTAAEVVYDPITQLMTAHGSSRIPAELLDEEGLSTGSFDYLRYNTGTDEVQEISGFHGNIVK
jgi:lipopolysaccharide export system protein LptA